MGDLDKLTDWGKLKGMLDKKQSSATQGRSVDEAALLAHLRGRVKGQDPILEDVARLIRLQYGRQNAGRPLANLLFLGPTGTGKTELAKALAEFLFGDEKAMLRFDCSELSGEHSKDRLVGMPTGYKGSEMGGHLTRPVLSNPKRLVLFDEIEKAAPIVFDLFLQLMGEGRLTEQGSNKTADFTQSVIVLTSNAHAEEIGKVKTGHSDYHEMVNAIKGHLADTKVFRPEILGRIDRVYVFDPLGGIVVAEIALLKVTALAKSYGLTVRFVAPELLIKALAANDKVSRFGIRELERILFDMFAPAMATARDQGAKAVRFEPDSSGKITVGPEAKV